MDFSTLLHVAQQKSQTSKNDVKYYSTKFEPPKKEEKKKDKLSENIKKFLARKEAEEKQKAEEARIKKLELLALRAQDSKAKKRIAFMLNRTKSANKAVIDDAIDHKNTALTLAGPSQPDEDDYGYESQESAAIYAKMMERYNSMPEEDKFGSSKKRAVSTNLTSTKERVKAALLREEEEANMPHKRKRKSKTDDGSSANDDISNNNYEPEKPDKEKEKPKKRPPAPPPMNFNDLLKIAEQKQHEPIIIEPKKPEPEEPLLTKKQKRELEKEKAWRESREARLRAALTNPSRNREPSTSSSAAATLSMKSDSKAMPPPNKIPKLNSSRNENRDIKMSNGDVHRKLNGSVTNLTNGHSEKISKINNSASSNKNTDSRSRNEPKDFAFKRPDSNSSSLSSKSLKKLDPNRAPLVANKTSSNTQSKEVLNRNTSQNPQKSRVPSINDKSKISTMQQRPNSGTSVESKPRQYLPGDLRAKQQQQQQNQQVAQTNTKPKQLQQSQQRKVPASDPKQKSMDVKPKQFPPADLKPKQFPPADLKPKQFPPTDLKPKQFPPADLKPKQFPPPDVRARQFPSKDVKRKPKRPIIDDDSEYDSELDDFIDDGPQEDDMDYSRHIKEIFGYDKSRYRDLDDDDDAAMESKFSTILKEEYISTKIGIMEDLEDIRKEAEEKKRKALLKKKMKR